jgi:hypothetical protein
MKGNSKNFRLAKRTGGKCKPEQPDFESTLDADCESSIGGTDITIKPGVFYHQLGWQRGKTSRP